MKPRSISQRRWESFACLVVIAAVFGVNALVNHELGTINAMGPGFFPFILSIVMAGLAVLILIQPDEADAGAMRVSLRPFISILASVAAFAVLVGPAGLFPATAVAVTTAATGSKGFSWGRIICLGLAAAVFCAVVFVYALALPIPLLKRPF